jgi:hypothetical protein
MAGCDFTSALAQLLTNPVLRETFLSNPEMAADLINVSTAERALFISLSAEQLKRQAQLLITKRMRAVFEQLPITVKCLGADAAKCFFEYATQYWPNTYNRHYLDAMQFCQYLSKHKLPCNQSEYNRSRFRYTGRCLRFCLTKDAKMNGKARWVLQVLYQLRGKQAEWHFYFKV